MSHNEIWDDSALVDSWNEALEEYKHYHSLHARGETVEDAIADSERGDNSKDAERAARENGAPEEAGDRMEVEDSDGPRVRKGDDNSSAQQGHKLQASDKVSLGEGDGQSTTKPNDGPSSAQPPLPQHLIGAGELRPTIVETALTIAVGDENLKNLLMSWYYAGYYTGLYEGQQKISPADEGKTGLETARDDKWWPDSSSRVADVVSFKVVPLALEPPGAEGAQTRSETRLRRQASSISTFCKGGRPHRFWPPCSTLHFSVQNADTWYSANIEALAGRSACRAHGLSMFRASSQALGSQSEWSIRFSTPNILSVIMKFSAVSIALAALPFALGGLIAEPIAARNGHIVEIAQQKNEHEGKQQSAQQLAEVIQLQGNQHAVVQEIIILWVNNGGGATTTVVNAAATTAAAAAAAATHTVAVGGSAGLVFVPDTVNAAVGDSVVFVFHSQNHTVTQSTFDTPCVKLADGMDSGFMPNPNNTIVPPPMMAMQVTVATPLWFYCKQGPHCGKGMTFSINPTAAKSQADFKQLAIAQNGTGEVANIVGGTTSVGAGAAATTTAAAAAAATDAAANNSAGTDMAAGTGAAGAGGACACSCFCGVSSFPLSAQGIGARGGVSGSLPMAAAFMS
ncbi:hypothetical protein V491_02437 [Pseudogymnoascus sp. VKM F-3775]|nr:hypothetical protein V491_02437 [Pseudogymnoascus sp. VKM F-3775]